MREFTDFVFVSDKDSLKRLKEFGFSNVIVCKDFDNVKSFTEFKSTVKNRVAAVIKNANDKKVKDARKVADIIIAEGGSGELNKKIVRLKNVDILLHPISRSINVDSETITVANDNKVLFALDFSEFVNLSSYRRATLLGKYKFLVSLLKAGKSLPIIMSGANDISELRGARDLASFGTVFGLSIDQSLRSLSRGGK